MTPAQAAELLRELRTRPLPLAELGERIQTLGSPWTPAQLRLFLMTAPGVRYDGGSGAFRAEVAGGEEALQEAILEAVRSFAGRPVPAAQVRARLPHDFVTTDQQILAVVRRTPGLEVFGPNLIRTTR